MKIQFNHRWVWDTMLDSSCCVDNITIEIFDEDNTSQGVVKMKMVI